jgi:prepilin-type N-terminal cleavage/methylation domain-containing protein
MHRMTQRRQSGFTVIELILVLVVIAILAALVAFSYNGVRSRDRDTQRQENITAIQGDLELFYAEHSRYPTLNQLNSPEWRGENMPDLSEDALRDPGWSADGECAQEDRPVFIAQPAENCYAYAPTAADGEPCDNNDKPCAHYTLTTPLESGEDYVRTSLN